MESVTPLYEAVLTETGIDPAEVMQRERTSHEEMMAPYHERVEEIYDPEPPSAA